jgi:hypothetical protein
MSLSFSNAEVAATDVAEPLTSSPITRGSGHNEPSATRTTLTSDPFAHNPFDKAALNVANPHGVGGYVLRMPKLAEPEGPCLTKGTFEISSVDGALKLIPTGGCHRRVRRELLLFKINGGQLTSSGTGWVPNVANSTRDKRLPRTEPSQDRQANGVPTDNGVGTLRREVPLGLLGRLALPDEGPDSLVDDGHVVKACCVAILGRGWQVLIEDEVA